MLLRSSCVSRVDCTYSPLLLKLERRKATTALETTRPAARAIINSARLNPWEALRRWEIEFMGRSSGSGSRTDGLATHSIRTASRGPVHRCEGSADSPWGPEEPGN